MINIKEEPINAEQWYKEWRRDKLNGWKEHKRENEVPSKDKQTKKT